MLWVGESEGRLGSVKVQVEGKEAKTRKRNYLFEGGTDHVHGWRKKQSKEKVCVDLRKEMLEHVGTF